MRPATLEGVAIESQGCRLFGGKYLAAGEAPAPAVVLLHSLPGHEQNRDLAQWLRGLGTHVLFFHYRGAWGLRGNVLSKPLPARHSGCPGLRPRSAGCRSRPPRRGGVEPGRLGGVGGCLPAASGARRGCHVACARSCPPDG